MKIQNIDTDCYNNFNSIGLTCLQVNQFLKKFFRPSEILNKQKNKINFIII